MSACFVLGLYFLIIYFVRNKDIYLFYFSGMNFFLGLYLSTMNEQILSIIFNYNFTQRVRIQIIAIVIMTVCTIRFVYRLFDKYIDKKTIDRVSIILSMLLLSIFFIDNKNLLNYIGVLQIIFFGILSLGYIYSFRMLFKAIYEREDSIEYILVSITSMFTYVLILSLKVILDINLGYIVNVLIIISMFSSAFLVSNKLHLDYQKAKKLAEREAEVELKYFYSQISPHFLYNTLNTIIGLSYNRGKETREALNNLSIYLRSKLNIHKDTCLIPIENEIELVKAYLNIEKIRYGERLEIQYNIEKDIHTMVPPLSIQTIIENAVHHGIAPKSDGGKISLTIKKDYKGFINIIIEDNGIGMNEELQKELLEGKKDGIGFKNVLKRIDILEGAELLLESSLKQGTKVKIIIPEVN